MKWTRLLAATVVFAAACDQQSTAPEQSIPGSELMEVGPLTSDILRPGPAPAQSSMVLAESPSTELSAVIGPIPAGGAHTDILWRRATTGENLVWRMSGVSHTGSSTLLSNAASTWEVGGVADFNRDGRPDILWRRPSTSSNVIWILNGTGGVADVVSLPTAAPEWRMAGAGDFDRDGSPDILWRRPSTSSVVLWMMNRTTLRDIVSLPALDSTWAVGGIADMTGDGNQDIVVRRQSTGTNTVWRMTGTHRTAEVPLRTQGGEWVLAGVADFTRDNNADLVWRRASTRETVIWAMQGTSYTEGDLASLPLVNAEWAIAAVADFDPPPPAPTGVTAAVASSSRIDLAWQDRGTLETSYRVEVRAGADSSWTLLATLPENTIAYAHQGVTAGVTYTYRIVACNATGCSLPSATVAAATSSSSAPTANTAAAPFGVGTTSTVGGSAVPNGLASTAWVELDDNAGMTSPAISDTVFIGSASATYQLQKQFSGLTLGGTYYYRVVARNSAGTTSGAVVSFVNAPPPAPVELTGAFQVTLADSIGWKLPANWRVSHAQVERRTPADSAWEAAGSEYFCWILSDTKCINHDTRTNTPTTTTYRVRLCNETGCGPWAETSVTTQVFAPPTNLVATAGADRVTLTWTDNTPYENYYNVQRRSEFQTQWQTISTYQGVDQFVDPGVRYYYRVYAVARSGSMSGGYAYHFSTTSNTAEAVPY